MVTIRYYTTVIQDIFMKTMMRSSITLVDLSPNKYLICMILHNVREVAQSFVLNISPDRLSSD